MYVRKKIIKGRTYFYLVKSVRNGSSVRQVYLEYLGAEPPSKTVLKRKIREYEKKSR